MRKARRNQGLLFCLYFFVLLNVSNLSAKGIVILVHGSFAINATWHQPNGNFYERLKKSSALLNKKVISFLWAGSPRKNIIQNAGILLAEIIKSYPPNEEITLIGHSHGGNVIAIASQQLVPLPLNDSKEETTHNQNLSQILFSLTITPRKNLASIATKKYIINKIYLLGTPIDSSLYKLNMNVIEVAYNIYSQGDFIQSVGGTYDKIYPTQPGITNLEITIKNSGLLNSGTPTHSELHHELLAKWLLFIPEQLQSCNLGNFESFNPHINGKIHFAENTFPFYSANEGRTRSSFPRLKT